jgi:ribonuclease BN (tRNA processing enzyme)
MCDFVGAAIQSGRISRRRLLSSMAATAALATVGWCDAPDQAGWRNSRDTHRAVLLGTAGGPPWWTHTNREGIASAVVVGDRYYLIDAGEGVGRRIREAKLGDFASDTNGPLDALAGVFLTHLHSDHVVDLNNLLTIGLYNGLQFADRPVRIWGPGNRGEIPPLFGAPPAPPVTAPENPTPGTREMIDLIVRAYATDFNDRAFDNRKPVPAELFGGFDVPIPPEYTADPNGNPHPRMSPITFFEDERVRVSATLVQHAPIFPALAYRFDTEVGSVVFGGDTGPSDNLIELASGANILVHEVIDSAWVELLLPSPRDDAQEGLYQHLIRAHTLVEDVGPIAEAAGVRTLVLSHLVPGNWPEFRWQRAKRGFSGKLIVGRDLDSISLRASGWSHGDRKD